MPQFEPASFFPQIFWLGVIFSVLYFFVVRPTLPKVGRVIDEREGRVAGDLDAAEVAKGEADGIRTRYDAGMDEARAAAQAAVAAARDAATRASEAQLKQVAARLDADAAAAAIRLDASRNAARANLATTAAELTCEAVARLIGVVPAPAEVEAALAARNA